MTDADHHISKSIRVQVNTILNLRLEDVIELQMRLEHTQWNIKGPNFISMQALFDKVADALIIYLNSMTQNIVQMDGIADGKISQVSIQSELA